MKTNKKSIFKRVISLLCVAAMLTTMIPINGLMKEVQAADTTQANGPVYLEGFKHVTLNSFADGNGNLLSPGEYTVDAGLATYYSYCLRDFKGNNIESFDNTLLSFKVKFVKGNYTERIMLAGNRFSDGLALYSSPDGNSLILSDILYNWGDAMTSNGQNVYFSKDTAGVSTFLNEEFLIQISFNYVDAEGDGNINDVQLGFYFNGKAYGEEPILLSNCNMEQFGNFFNVYLEHLSNDGAAIVLSDAVPVNNNLTDITWSDFSRDGVPAVNRTFPVAPIDNTPFSYTLDKQGLNSLDSTSFEAWVTFESEGDWIYYGGKDNAWYGIAFAPMSDGNMQVFEVGMNIGELPITLNKDIAGVEFLNNEFRLKVTTEFGDYDRDGEEDDVQLGIFFNDKLYNNQYFYLNDCKDSFGTLLNIYPPNAGITMKSVGPVFLEDYENVTISDFQDANGNQMESTTYQMAGWVASHPFTMRDADSFDKKVLSMNVCFGYGNYTERIQVAANNNSAAAGFSLYSSADGNYLTLKTLNDEIKPSYLLNFSKDIAGLTSFMNQEFVLQISFAYGDYDADGDSDDVKLGFYFDGRLYDNQELVITDCNMEGLGNYLTIYLEAINNPCAAITVSEAAPKYTRHPEKPEIIVAQAEDWNRLYFPDVARTKDGLIAAYYQNNAHVPMNVGAQLGRIYKVTGSKDGLTWSEPEEFIGPAFLEENGLGIWRDLKSTPADTSDDVFYYSTDDPQYADTPYYYYTGTGDARVKNYVSTLPETCKFDMEVRDPNFTRLQNGTIVFTFFNFVPIGAVVEGRQVTGSGVYGSANAYIMYTENDGSTWSKPEVIPSDYLDIEAVKRGSIAEYSDGSMLIPLYGTSSKFANGEQCTVSFVHAKISADGTWDFTGETGPLSTSQMTEVGLCATSNDTTYALCRDTNELYVSEDKGKTWTVLYKESVPVGYLSQPTLTKLIDSDKIFATWSEVYADSGRNVVGKIFDTELGWEATEKVMIYRDSNIQGEIGYPYGWQQDMSDPTGIQLENGNFFTIFYNTKWQCIGGRVMTMEELYVPTEAQESNALSEDFENQELGAYTSDNSIEYYTQWGNGSATVMDDGSGNKFLRHTENAWQMSKITIPIENEQELSFDVRMPDSAVHFDINVGNDGMETIRFYAGQNDGNATLTFSNHLGEQHIEPTADVIPTGSNAAWYTIKLLKLGNTICMKVWARGSEEPASYQYEFSNDTYFTSATDVRLRAAEGYYDLDNIRVANRETKVTGNGYCGAYDGNLHDITVDINFGNSVSYRWYKGGKEEENFILATLEASYSVKDAEDSGTYYCKVLVDGKAYWSDAITVSITGVEESYILKEDFEDKELGAYPSDNSITYYTQWGNGSATVMDDGSGNKFLRHTENAWQMSKITIPIENDQELSFDVRMPNSAVYFDINVGNDGFETIRFYAEQNDGNATLTFSNHLGEQHIDPVADVIPTGSNAAWYTIKLVKRDNTICMKVWARGSEEPASYQYELSNDTYFPSATDVRLRAAEGYYDLDNIRVAEPKDSVSMVVAPEITDSIAMIYTATIDETLLAAEVEPYMTFVMNGKTLVNVIGEPVSSGSNVYTFKYSDVKAQNMAETITATLVVGDYTKEYQHSVWDYCKAVLDSTDGTDLVGLAPGADLAELKHLVVDLVQYGAEVQEYRIANGMDNNVSEDLLLSNKLTDAYKALDTDQATESLNGIESQKGLSESQTNFNYKWTSATLVLKDKINLRFRFAVADGYTKDVVIKVTIGGTTYTFQGTDIKKDAKSANGYYVDFDNIMANEYGEAVQVTIYSMEDEAVSATITYSVNSYLSSMSGNNVTLNELLVAIHSFGTTAKQYKEQ